MKPPRLILPVLFALGLVVPSAMAQTSFLAVSEVSGGANSRGEVAIFQQDSTTGAATPFATITSSQNLANPMGLAFATDSSGDGHLYIAGLGTSQIVDFNVNTAAVSTFAVAGHTNLGGLAVSGGTLYVSAFDGGSAASPGAVLEYGLAGNGSITGLTGTAQGGGLVGPTGLAVNGTTVYVNSSATNQVYTINGSTTPVAQNLSGVSPQPSAPAGMAFGSGTLLYETNFFTTASGAAGITSYSVSGSTLTEASQTNPADYHNPAVGGPADVVLGPVTNQVLVSDFGDGLIYQYTADGTALDGPTTYLSGLSTPTYMAEFTVTGSTQLLAGAHAVPEPAGLTLLVLGGAAGLFWRRRLTRTKATG